MNEINLGQSEFASPKFCWILLEVQSQKFCGLNLFKLM